MKNKKQIEFKYNLAMRVSKEQFKNELELPLIALGYEIIDPVAWGEYLILVTNHSGKNGVCSYVIAENKILHDRTFIEGYNPEMFLDMASQTQPIKEKITTK
jgi:hypothetical protein